MPKKKSEQKNNDLTFEIEKKGANTYVLSPSKLTWLPKPYYFNLKLGDHNIKKIEIRYKDQVAYKFKP